MRWARFEHEGAAGYGIVEDDAVEAVEGTPFGEYRRTGVRHPLAGITLQPGDVLWMGAELPGRGAPPTRSVHGLLLARVSGW